MAPRLGDTDSDWEAETSGGPFRQVATPVDWQSGEDVIIVPTLCDEEARGKFPDGWKTPKPHLRVVPQPK
jgi:hypothetical protein